MLGVLRSFQVVGVPPEIMGVGPLYAIPKAVEAAGLTLDDIDVYEINEAFASQALYCVRELGIDQDKANELGITDFDEVMKECGIYRNPMLYSTDEMRTLVDQKRMLLPYNDEILGQLQGQRYTHTKSNVDSYGRKSYTAGSFHIFDGMRMAVMCWAHEEIDRMLNEHQKTKRKEKRPGPVVPQWA